MEDGRGDLLSEDTGAGKGVGRTEVNPPTPPVGPTLLHSEKREKQKNCSKRLAERLINFTHSSSHGTYYVLSTSYPSYLARGPYFSLTRSVDLLPLLVESLIGVVTGTSD